MTSASWIEIGCTIACIIMGVISICLKVIMICDINRDIKKVEAQIKEIDDRKAKEGNDDKKSD